MMRITSLMSAMFSHGGYCAIWESSMRCSAGMGSCNRAQLPEQSYGLIYARLTGIASSPLDVGVHTYRFRRAEVNHGLRFGDVYKGKVRVGVDRTPNFQNTLSEKLDVVLYDAEMKVLAKIASYDWAAGDIRTRHR